MTGQRKNIGAARRITRCCGRIGALLWFASMPAHADMNLGGVFTDLWWNATESGWGVTVDHQDQVMFVTFYVHRADGSPYWVTAILDHVGASKFTFSGDLFETHGPWFGGTFNPAQVVVRKAGTARFASTDVLTATLDYTVDGTRVAKTVSRQTLRSLNFSGTFAGMLGYVTGNCSNPQEDGEIYGDAGLMTIAHSGGSMRLTWEGEAGTCTYDGAYTQAGSLGTCKGAYSCTDGSGGSFTLAGMQWTIAGMTAIVSGRSQGCSFAGALTGMMPH